MQYFWMLHIELQVVRNIATSRQLRATCIVIPIQSDKSNIQYNVHNITVALQNISICDLPWVVETRCACARHQN
uniref:Uncharacterized protein n=1 Tax=Glossina palpalis gambiensis TaxID=67801 RepID=A0A1B0BHJ6_9MUSC